MHKHKHKHKHIADKYYKKYQKHVDLVVEFRQTKKQMEDSISGAQQELDDFNNKAKEARDEVAR